MAVEIARFLVLEFDGGGLVFAKATRDNPRATVDMISEPLEDEDGLYYSAVFMVKGLGESAMARLERDLAKTYGKPRTLRRDFVESTWMGRIKMRAAAMSSAGAQVFNSIHTHWGIPWAHIEGGQILIRARLNDPNESAALCEALTKAMAEHGVEAQAEVQEMPLHDLGVWKDLVAASLGLSA